MHFKGMETDDQTIILKAQHPPGCLDRINTAAALWLSRLLVAGLWFGLGLIIGWLTA